MEQAGERKMGRGGEGVWEKGEGVGRNGTAPYFSSSLAVLFSSRACFELCFLCRLIHF